MEIHQEDTTKQLGFRRSTKVSRVPSNTKEGQKNAKCNQTTNLALPVKPKEKRKTNTPTPGMSVQRHSECGIMQVP